ncbi:OLC1v1038755C1 [Oldenlandia corymbosa var. corymbosa]|uniref:OLC1v1038755C1 n=1 Tax=Oldenlandia corymbosa var. corymbosa TaxID=529605 RepID=A0AAV1D0K4_OLDCO|nr:OLC1v1038755C1 [Oldenlandia corymbosa var. corymbosa]
MFEGQAEKSNKTKYYEILGTWKTYWKATWRNHPDNGGDPRKYQMITEAYSVLSDPKKRDIYDQYGEDAVKQQGNYDQYGEGAVKQQGNGSDDTLRRRRGDRRTQRWEILVEWASMM